MRRTEDHHNNGEQVRGYVLEALQVALDCELSDAERVAMLPQILALVSAKQVFYEQIGMAGGIQLPRPQG